jgi:hypothetical protein
MVFPQNFLSLGFLEDPEIHLNFLIFGCGFGLKWSLRDIVKVRQKSLVV